MTPTTAIQRAEQWRKENACGESAKIAIALLNELQALQASRAIPEGHVVVPGWRPIESAPKDGQLVLLCNRKGNHGDGYWLKEAYSGNGAWIWTYIHREPTHWMPLPAAPAPEGEA